MNAKDTRDRERDFSWGARQYQRQGGRCPLCGKSLIQPGQDESPLTIWVNEQPQFFICINCIHKVWSGKYSLVPASKKVVKLQPIKGGK